MARRSRDGYLLAIDAGTGTLRALLFDTRGARVRVETQPRRYVPDPSGGDFLTVFDAAALWRDLCALLRSLLRGADVEPEAVLGVSATAQRFSYVFLDEQGEVLYAGPNLDARGAFTQAEIEATLGPKYYQRTGQWPPLTSALARLLWFRMEARDVFDRIRHVLMLNDWILYQLCGHIHSEVTAASASGLLDVVTGSWSASIRDAFGLQGLQPPPLTSAGQPVGTVSPEAARATGLRAGTPVLVGGADTQCALLGSGSWGADQLCVVAGTTAPLCYVVASPHVDPEKRVWTSCHLEPDRWILEANSQWAGYVIQWVRDLVTSAADDRAPRADVYAWLETKAMGVPPGSDDTYALLGPAIMDEKCFHVIRPGVLLFPPPAHPLTERPAGVGHLFRSAMENITFALRANLELLKGIRPIRPERLHVTGGLAKSRLFRQILSDCLELPVSVARVREGSAMGTAVCAATGAGLFPSLEEAQQGLVVPEESLEPNAENVEIYGAAFERWRTLYEKIEDL